jgi:hypothetical protein
MVRELVLFTEYNFNNGVKEGEMVRVCITHRGEERERQRDE